MADAVQKQSQELATQLWAIANELRGNMDASKFKNLYSWCHLLQVPVGEDRKLHE